MTRRAGVEAPRQSPLGPFASELALEMSAGAGVKVESIDGSMLSADISGFTALTERLADKGKAGAEEITSLINTCFQTLIDVAATYGGDVIKFGGDAILVLFRGEDHAVRAGTAGITMQYELANLRAAQRALLSMTVGVSHGPFDAFLVGDEQRELLLTGANASEVIRLEAACEKGGTLCSPDIVDAMATRLGHEAGGGLMLQADSPEPVMASEGELAPHVPATVRAQLAAFDGMGGEHRLVSLAFLQIDGVDERIAEVGADQVGRDLDALVTGVRTICADHSVTVLHSDIAPSGAKLLLAAGAPVTSGNDEDGILHAGLAIAAIDTSFDIRIGAHRGRVFAGFLGAAERRAYTLMGDTVNTAARLLGQAAPGELIAHADLVESTYTIYETEQLEPFQVKGKAAPLIAHRVKQITSRRRRSLADVADFIGRTDEQSVVQATVNRPGGIIEISGPNGVGKSRLVSESVDGVEEGALFLATAAPYGSNSPYSLFRPLLRRRLGLAPMVAPEDVGSALTTAVQTIAPELMPFLPLLAIPFGAMTPMTDAVEAIDPEFRRQRLHETFVAFLDAAIGETDAVLIAEDVHWMDEASSDLLTYLLAAFPDKRWRCVVTHNGDATWSTTQLDGATSLVLDPLDRDATLRLAKDISQQPLADSTLQTIVERSGGNPLFCIELASSAGDGGALPDSIEAATASRIDELPPGLRRALRIAAVFGQDFSTADVEVIAGTAEVRQFPELSFFERQTADTLRFLNATVREVAYEGLPYNERRRIHARIGAHLEATGRESELTLLAMHFSEGGIHAKAWDYGRRAGELAVAQLAHQDAAAAFERALRSARYLKLDSHDRRDVAAALGRSLSVIGRFDDARKAYDQARKYNSDEVLEVDYLREVGSLHERSGRTAAALSAFSRASGRIADETTDDRLLGARARVRLAQSGIVHRRGEQQECRELAKLALSDARAAGDRTTEALALERIHLASTYLGEAGGEHGEQALALFRELGDRNAEASVLNNLGIAAYFAEDWSTARVRYAEAAEAAAACGNVVFGGSASLNGAEILSDQGQWNEALDLLADVQRNWEAAGYATGVAAATLFAGIASMRRGDHDDAIEAMSRAAEDLERIGVHELVAEANSRILQARAAAGLLSVEDTATAADAMPDGFALRSHRSCAVSLASAGNGAEAVRVLTASIGDVTSYEEALSVQVLMELSSDADIDDLVIRARAVFDRLGVTRTMYGDAAMTKRPLLLSNG